MVRFRRVASALALLAATGCGHGTEVRRLRIGMNPWPGYAHMAVAQEQRFFAAHGIDAKIVEYASLHDLRRGFAEGQIDVLPSTLVEVLSLSQAKDKAPVIVWVADASNGGDLVVARGVADAAGLRGRAIAYEAETVGAYLLARFLEKSGLPADSVRAVGMDQSRMADAMSKGEIDAAITYQPFAGQMQALPGTRTLFTSRSLPGEIVDTISIAGQLVDADPTLVARFQAAMADAHRFCADEPAIAAGIMGRVTSMSPVELREALESVVVYPPGEQPAWLVETDRLQRLASALHAALHKSGAPQLRLPARAALAPNLMPASPR